MAQTNTYADSSAYAADSARLADRSAFSFIREDNRQVFGGVNIVVDKDGADTGDLGVFDRTLGRNRFVKAGTVVKPLLPDALLPHSVVIGRVGRDLLLTPLKKAGSAAWGHSREARLSGLDRAKAGTLSLTMAAGGVSETAEASWDAWADSATLVSAITAAIGTLSSAANRTWSVAADGDDLILTHSSNAESGVSAVAGTGGGAGVTLVQDGTGPQYSFAYITSEEDIRRVSGMNSDMGGSNLRACVEYWSASGAAPTAAYGLRERRLASREAFGNSDYCSALREAYASYEDYVAGEYMLRVPAMSGAHLRDGKEVTALLASRKGTAVRGSDEPLYPAAALAASYGVTAESQETGLEAGAWWLPDIAQAYALTRGRRLRASDTADDPVNDTLTAMGGDDLYAAERYFWTACEYWSSGAYYYHRAYSICQGAKHMTWDVRPVTLV